MTETREQCYPRLGNGSAYNKSNLTLKETKLNKNSFRTSSLMTVGEIWNELIDNYKSIQFLKNKTPIRILLFDS